MKTILSIAICAITLIGCSKDSNKNVIPNNNSLANTTWRYAWESNDNKKISFTNDSMSIYWSETEYKTTFYTHIDKDTFLVGMKNVSTNEPESKYILRVSNDTLTVIIPQYDVTTNKYVRVN